MNKDELRKARCDEYISPKPAAYAFVSADRTPHAGFSAASSDKAFDPGSESLVSRWRLRTTEY